MTPQNTVTINQRLAKLLALGTRRRLLLTLRGSFARLLVSASVEAAFVTSDNQEYVLCHTLGVRLGHARNGSSGGTLP